MNEYGPPFTSTTHDIYLLRVWYEFDGPRAVWRASVLLPNDARRRYFSEPEALLHFLRQHVQPVDG